MRAVAELPPGLRPTSCRLMDNFQMRLSALLHPVRAWKEVGSSGALRTLEVFNTTYSGNHFIWFESQFCLLNSSEASCCWMPDKRV